MDSVPDPPREQPSCDALADLAESEGTVRPAPTTMRWELKTMEDPSHRGASACLTILQRYYRRRRSASGRFLMVAEVEAVAAWMMELDLPPCVAEDEVIRIVRRCLIACYGTKACQINADFAAAWHAVWADRASRTWADRVAVGVN